MFRSSYGTHKNILPEVISLCNSKKVVDIKYSESCSLSEPCQHYGGIILITEDNEWYHYDCGTIQIGIIMYYYGINNNHFTCYLDGKMKHEIDEFRNVNGIVTSSTCIIF